MVVLKVLFYIIFVILWIVFGILMYKIYHKVFDVVYLGSGGCAKEILVIFFLSMIAAGFVAGGVLYPFIKLLHLG